jgi:hypothetical protein
MDGQLPPSRWLRLTLVSSGARLGGAMLRSACSTGHAPTSTGAPMGCNHTRTAYGVPVWLRASSRALRMSCSSSTGCRPYCPAASASGWLIRSTISNGTSIEFATYTVGRSRRLSPRARAAATGSSTRAPWSYSRLSGGNNGSMSRIPVSGHGWSNRRGGRHRDRSGMYWSDIGHLRQTDFCSMRQC